MNLRTLMLTPWRASKPAAQGSALLLLVLAALVAIAAGIYSSKPAWWVGPPMIIGIGESFLWAFVMSSTVLLAIDARQLRLPGMQRSVIASLLLYGLLGVVVPTAVLSLFGGHPAATGAIIMLFCVGGFAFALLPRYLGMAMCLMPAALKALPPGVTLPGPADPDFLHFAMPATGALLLMLVLCWRRLLHVAHPYESGWTQPMVMQFRFASRRAGWNPWTGFGSSLHGVDRIQQIRRRPNWLQPKADLRDCGPGHPVSSLRTALGSLFMPLTMMARLRQLAFVIVPSLLYVVLIALQGVHRHGAAALLTVWHDDGLIMLIWFGAFGSMMLAFFCIGQLSQLWQKPNAELPLLALLPGLDDGAKVKRDLLRASLLQPMRVLTLLLLVSLTLVGSLHLGTRAALFVLLGQLGAMGFVVAFTLTIIGGRPLGPWATGALAIFGCILINVSLFVPTLSNPGQIKIGDATLLDLFVVCWMVLAVALLWLGRRGWRGLIQRPHPFLPN
jgi:hypothetical protein